MEGEEQQEDCVALERLAGRTVSLGEVWRLVAVGSVLWGVAVAPGVLPSYPLRLQAAGRVQAAVAPARRPGGVRVGQRLLAEAALEHGPARTTTTKEKNTDSVLVESHDGSSAFFICSIKDWERIR